MQRSYDCLLESEIYKSALYYVMCVVFIARCVSYLNVTKGLFFYTYNYYESMDKITIRKLSSRTFNDTLACLKTVSID